MNIISNQIINKPPKVQEVLTDDFVDSSNFEYKEVETIQELDEVFESSAKMEEFKETVDHRDYIVYEVDYSDECQKQDLDQDLDFIGIQENIVLKPSKFDENVYLTPAEEEKKVVEERILDNYGSDTNEDNQFGKTGFTSSEEESQKIK